LNKSKTVKAVLLI